MRAECCPRVSYSMLHTMKYEHSSQVMPSARFPEYPHCRRQAVTFVVTVYGSVGTARSQSHRHNAPPHLPKVVISALKRPVPDQRPRQANPHSARGGRRQELMLGWRSRLAYLSHKHGYCRYHSTAKKADNKHFSSSILLPRTRFPLRNDPSKDKTIQRKTTENLYRWQV